jgi:D-alanine transaminase
MRPIAYVNGAYVPLAQAHVSIGDRGFQFADSIYEVWAVREGRIFDCDAHMARLRRSLSEVRIAAPMSERSLMTVIREMIRRNHVTYGIVYLQISRGAASRDHVFPGAQVKPTIVVTAKNLDRKAIEARATKGVKIITTPETRWARRDIKSVNMLPNVLARQAAKEAGAFEAWFVDGDGYVTEGTSSNAWIVDASGRLRTRPLSHDVLHGVTRAVVLQIARALQLQPSETPFSVEDAKSAREAFLTAASNPAVAVVEIDGAPIGDGRPGPVSTRLRAAYLGAELSA